MEKWAYAPIDERVKEEVKKVVLPCLNKSSTSLLKKYCARPCSFYLSKSTFCSLRMMR